MRARSVPTMSTLSQRNFHQFINDKTVINTSHSQLTEAIEQLTQSLILKKEYFTQEYLRQIVNFIQKVLKNDLVINDSGALQLIEQLLAGCARVNKSNTANFLLKPFEREDIVQAANWHRISIYETILRECTDEQVLDGLHERIRFYIHLLNSYQHPQWFIKTALRCVRRIAELFQQKSDIPQKVRLQREQYVSNIQNQLLNLKLVQRVRVMSHGIAGGLFAELLDGELVNQDQKYKLLQELHESVEQKERARSAPIGTFAGGPSSTFRITALGAAGEPWHGPGARPRSSLPGGTAGVWTEVKAQQLAGSSTDDAADALSVKRNLGIEAPREARLTVSASKSGRTPKFIPTPPRHLAYFTMADRFVGCTGYATGTPGPKCGSSNTMQRRAISAGNVPGMGPRQFQTQTGRYQCMQEQYDGAIITDNRLSTPNNNKPSVAERFGFGSSIRRFVPTCVVTDNAIQEPTNRSQVIQEHTNDSTQNIVVKNVEEIVETNEKDQKQHQKQEQIQDIIQNDSRHSIDTIESVDMESLSKGYESQKRSTISSAREHQKQLSVKFHNIKILGESQDESVLIGSSAKTPERPSSAQASKYNYHCLDESSASERNWNISAIQKVSNVSNHPPIRVSKHKENNGQALENTQKCENSIKIQDSPLQDDDYKDQNITNDQNIPIQPSESTAISEVVINANNLQNSREQSVNQSTSGYTTSQSLGTTVTWAPGVICQQSTSQEISQVIQDTIEKNDIYESRTAPGTNYQQHNQDLERKTVLSAPSSAQTPERNSQDTVFSNVKLFKDYSLTQPRQGILNSTNRCRSLGSTFSRVLSENQQRYLCNSYIFQNGENKNTQKIIEKSQKYIPGIPVHMQTSLNGVYDSGLRNTAFNAHLSIDYDKYRNCLANQSPYRRAPSATGGGINSTMRSPRFQRPELSQQERSFFEQAKRISALRHSKLNQSQSGRKNKGLIVSEIQQQVKCPGVGVKDMEVDAEIGEKKEKCKEFLSRAISRSSIASQCVKDLSECEDGDDDLVDQPGLLYIQLRNGTELSKEQILEVRSNVESMFTLNHGRELSMSNIDQFYNMLRKHRPFLNVFEKNFLQNIANAIIQYIVEKDVDISVSYLWQAYLLGFCPSNFYFGKFNRLRLQFRTHKELRNLTTKQQQEFLEINQGTKEKMKVLYLQWRGHKECKIDEDINEIDNEDTENGEEEEKVDDDVKDQ